MPNHRGNFIWYELITPDPSAAKRFYDAVVGWDIATESVAPGIEYRMIRRSDGGNAGGVLTLTDEMMSNGARPVWLGYLYTNDVDAAVEAIVAEGGSAMMPPWDQPGVGRLAMVTDADGAPFYLMDPLPPRAGRTRLATFSPSMSRSMSAGMNCRPTTRTGRLPSTPSISDGAKRAACRWAKWATTSSCSMTA
ncbi:VOC family protein [Sphingomonas sp. HDW15A]|uniref:VOC family protein n=1 Tax=Sphingomonas sp. HDW15A TaxID=2714942 RepID=UPI001F10188D|nr:VOC family protein [Sphingomonas sp. HDW15A]